MIKNYSFLSEILRTGSWMMEPSAFSYYKNLLSLTGMDVEAIDHIRWGEKRTEGSLLVFKPGQSEPETRLIQTRNTHWYSSEEISKDDQIIHVLPITGAITHGGAECSYGTRELADRFIYADNQECVIGHLVILDTPGGSAMANDLDQVLAKAQKPTVALIRGMNASKGVWISSFIPYVFAEREDVEIGCIGAMWAMQGMRNGVNQFNQVYYEVYAENSIYKNEEYREAIQNDNLKPAIESLNKLEADFRTNVKKRWPNVSEEKLKGKMYKASEVIGEMVDGIKSYSQAVNFIFELAGVSRKEVGIVTTLGVIGVEEPEVIDTEDPGEKKKRPGCETAPKTTDETTQSATGTEEPVQTNNTNPQTLIIPMANKEFLEAIPGMGSVAVDDSGNASLTAEQYEVLNAHLQKGNAAMKLANTQQETIIGLQQQLSEKEGTIKELAEATGKPIQQPAPENDNAVEQPINKVKLVTSENASHYDNINKMREYMSQHGMIS